MIITITYIEIKWSWQMSFTGAILILSVLSWEFKRQIFIVYLQANVHLRFIRVIRQVFRFQALWESTWHHADFTFIGPTHTFGNIFIRSKIRVIWMALTMVHVFKSFFKTYLGLFGISNSLCNLIGSCPWLYYTIKKRRGMFAPRTHLAGLIH